MYQVGIHKIFSVAMTFMVLLSTLSFTVEKHYCGDTLMDAAIFSKVDPCCDIDLISSIELEKKICCSDKIEVVKGQDTLKKVTFEDLHFEQQVFFATFYHSYHTLFEGLSEQVSSYTNYSPPHLVPDIRVLYQVFII